MKKIIIAALFTVCCATAAKAQWYVGGDIGFSRSSDRIEANGVTTKTKTTGFSLTPRVGYIFNPRWSAGLGVGYVHSKNDPDEGTKTINRGLSAAPYVRYNFLFFGPFALGAEAKAGYGNTYGESGANRTLRTESMGIDITPVLDLEISKNISLESRLNFFAFGYNYSKSTSKQDGSKTVVKNDTFGARLNGDELFTTGDITFGVIFVF